MQFHQAGGGSPIVIEARAFAAGDFTASVGTTWTVEAGDVTTFRYVIQGDIMSIWLRLLTTTVSVAPGLFLNVLIPESRVALVEQVFSGTGTSNGGFTEGVNGFVSASAATIGFLRYSANWAVGANNTSLNAQFSMLLEPL